MHRCSSAITISMQTLLGQPHVHQLQRMSLLVIGFCSADVHHANLQHVRNVLLNHPLGAPTLKNNDSSITWHLHNFAVSLQAVLPKCCGCC